MKKSFIIFSTLLSVLLSSCSLLGETKQINTPTDETSTVWDGKGYLEISLRTAGLMNTEYLFVGENGYHFDAKGKLDNGRDAVFTDNATWTSSNPEVFVSNGMGNFKALKDGTATITATYGEFSDSYDVNVKTFATIKALTATEDEYRTTRTYNLPIHIEPLNAFVIYTPSVENAIEILPEHKFIPRIPGEIEVNAKVFIAEDGRTKDFNFILNIVENDTPYFKFNNNVSTSGDAYVAVNKFDNFESFLATTSLQAFKGNDDSEITSQIYVKEGNCNTKEIGEYNLVMGVENNGIESLFNLKVNVIEKEEDTTYLSKVYPEVNVFQYNIDSSQKIVNVTIKATLPDTFEKYTGEFVIDVHIKAKRANNYEFDLTKTVTSYVDHTSEKLFTFNFEVKSETYTIKQDDGIVSANKSVTFSGYGHNYITYPAN